MAEIMFGPDASRSAWASALALVSAPASGGKIGVGIERRERVEVVSLMIGIAERPEVAPRLGRALGLTLPDMGRVRKFAASLVVGTAPNHWTVLRSGANSRSLACLLTEAIGGPGFVVDQTGGRALLRVSGGDAAKLMRKGCPIDLHPGVFDVGHAASTVIEHVPAQIWRSEPALAYDIMVGRSHAEDLAHWLKAGAAEFGYFVSERMDL